MASLMPVRTAMNGGIGAVGLTRVWNSPSCSPPRTLTAPTSVIREPTGRRASGGLQVDDAEGDLAQRAAELVEARLHCHPAMPGDATGRHRRFGVATRRAAASVREVSGTPGPGPHERPHAGPRFPAAGERWRCGGCGNLTRFDVVHASRAREFWHVDLSGDGVVEESTVLGESVESVTCRWCGRADAIEYAPRAGPGGR